jgi:hypothetical protein
VGVYLRSISFGRCAGIGLISLALVGCVGGSAGEDEADTGDETGEDGGLPPIDPAICQDMEFDNEVDEAACDDVYGRGAEPEMADEIELCRRLYVDLTGALPTRKEFENDCQGRKVGAIVDDLMGRDAYVDQGRRLWADLLFMTSSVTYFEYIVALDDLVGQLYRGEIKLPKFAELVATHPGFTGRFDGQDLVGYSFLAFLGRDAAPHERLGLEPLWHLWQERFEEQHPTYYFGYSREVVNTILCMGSNEGTCHSDLWGHHSVVIPVVEEGNYDYEGVNVFAVEDLSGDQWNTLRLPGRLIAMQPVFYETAAARSLERYLGYDAGAQLPLVRQRLVDMLMESGGNIREIEREILTSELYVMAAAVPPPEDAGTGDTGDGETGDAGEEEFQVPDFWHGPMKQLMAEAWLDSVEKLTGVEVGGCDHRFTDVQAGRPTDDSPYEDTWWHPNEFPKDDDPTWAPEQNKPDYTYRDIARQLGGCPDQQGQLRYTGTGVMISIGYSGVLSEVCMVADPGSALYPGDLESLGKSEEDLRHITDAMVKAALTRGPPDELAIALDEAVSACRDSADCEPINFSQNVCRALLQSAPFVFY